MTGDQPLLPEKKTIEYSISPDHPPWTVGRWAELSAEFLLTESEVPAWHAVLVAQGRHWEIIRRRFMVAPLWGGDESPEQYLREWKFSELAAEWGVPEASIKHDFAASVDFWKRQKTLAKAQDSIPGNEEGVNRLDSGDIAPFAIHQHLDSSQIEELLTQFRFGYIRVKSDRLYVANRILELRPLLADKNTRESARTLITMELNMANHELTLSLLRDRLDVLRNKSADLSEKESQEIQKISEAAANTEKNLTHLSNSYRKAADELVADEAEAGEMRRIALGTISYFIEAIRVYYATGERVLIDGVFPADELVWQTTPQALRPAQYRPDISLRLREAMIPENLWAKDYEPTTIQREACRRMLKLVQSMADEPEPEAIPGIDDPVEDDDSDMDGSIPSCQIQDEAQFIPTVPPPVISRDADEPFMAIS